MRNLLVLVLVTASACAARAPRSTFTAEYSCGSSEMVRDGGAVRAGSSESRLAYSDDAGDHYISWPLSPTDRSATEFIIPSNPREDAIQRTYDATRGPSTADWRLVHKQTCTARGGYNDALARWMAGETIDTIAGELAIGRDEAKQVVREALMSAQTRYWKER
ncbi:MAG: hypothetical protein JO257_07080 [Deltaproteobacteria bacterium]|nr:hypothetical protein [Deltaproteobacteria bacterium]